MTLDQPTLEQFLREQFFAGYRSPEVRTTVRADGRVQLTLWSHDGTPVVFDVRLNELVAR